MSTIGNSTVMGPGPGGAPNKIFDPPKLSPTSDKLMWRKRVRLWARTVKSLAKGGDPKAVSAYHAMGFTLYQSIDDTYAGKLEGAIVAGTLKIEPDENEETKPLETVEHIIQLVARDSITDTVRREASMLKEIHACKRRDGEAASAFAHRYEGLALKYINNCDALGAKQISQSFAITLLDNAKIPPSVYSAIVSQMVSRANERGKEEEKLMVVPKETVRKTEDGIDKLVEEYKKFREGKNLATSDNEDPVIQRMLQTKLDISKIRSIQVHQESADRPNTRITLDDAVQALSDVKVEEASDKQHTHTDPRLLGSMLGKRTYGKYADSDHARTGRDKRTKPNTSHFDQSKQRCRLCKRKGHFYRDPVCIYNQIRSILNQDNDHSDGDSKDEGPRVTAIMNQLKTSTTGKEVHPKTMKKVSFDEDTVSKKSSLFQ